MNETVKTTFPEFAAGTTVVSRGSHFGDSRWLEVKVDTVESLQKLVRGCVDTDVAVVGGGKRPLPQDFGSLKRLVFADLSSCSEVVEHVVEDQVISVETGITLRDLNQKLSVHGQMFPVLYGSENVTLFDVICSGDGGILEHGYGGPRDLVLGLEVITGDGTRIKCGGKVVKNVTGYDLSKLFTGAHGTLGFPVVAHLRLFARPQSTATLLLTVPSLPEAIDRAAEIMALDLPMSCLEVVDARLLTRAVRLFDPGDSTGLGHSSVDVTNPYFAIIAQVYGSPDLVAESVEQIKAQKNSGKAVMLESSFEERLLPAFSNIGQVCELHPLELSLSTSDCRNTVQNWWRKNGKPPAQLRLGAGRLRLYYESTAAIGQPLQSFAQFASALSVPPVVSYADGAHHYKVQNLDAGASPNDVVKAQIKKRFDPANILNPLAQV